MCSCEDRSKKEPDIPSAYICSYMMKNGIVSQHYNKNNVIIAPVWCMGLWVSIMCLIVCQRVTANIDKLYPPS